MEVDKSGFQKAAEPLLDLRLLARRSLGVASCINFFSGLALYGSVYLLPLYLSQVQGYNAYQIARCRCGWACRSCSSSRSCPSC